MPVSKIDTTEFYSLRIESMLCIQIKHGCKEEDNNYDGLARKTLLLLWFEGSYANEEDAYVR